MLLVTATRIKGFIREQIHSLLALGSFYYLTNDAAIALDAYKEALLLLKEFPDELREAETYLGIARCELSANRQGEALQAGRQALEICSYNSFSQIEFNALLLLCDCCILQEKSDLAMDFINRTKLILDRWKWQEGYVKFWLHKARLHLTIGEKEEALKCWQESLLKLTNANNPGLLIEEKELFTFLAATFMEHKNELYQLFDTAKLLKERTLEFIHALVNSLPDTKKPYMLQIIQKQFATPLDSSMLRVFSLGLGSIYRNGILIEEKEWHIKKPKYLLLFLLANRSKYLSDDFLIDTFWPNMPLEKARNNLHHTVHHLRKILEPHKKDTSLSLYILRDATHYYFNTKAPYWWDVSEYEDAYAKGKELLQKGDLKSAIAAFKSMTQLYKENFLLENLEDEWVSLLRDRLLQKFYSGLIKLAKCLLSINAAEEALEYADKVLEGDPYNEEAYIVTMEILLTTNKLQDALRCYQKYKKIMRSVLKLPPSKRMEELYQEIIANRTSAKIK